MVQSNSVHQNECSTGVLRRIEHICITTYLTAVCKVYQQKSNVALPCLLNRMVCHAVSLVRNCCSTNTFPVPSHLPHRPYRSPNILPSFVIKVGFLQVLCQGDNVKAAVPETCVEAKSKKQCSYPQHGDI